MTHSDTELSPRRLVLGDDTFLFSESVSLNTHMPIILRDRSVVRHKYALVADISKVGVLESFDCQIFFRKPG